MGLLTSYRLRWMRKLRKLRAWHKGRTLTSVVNRTHSIDADDILLFCTFRNEARRLPYFLDYYRRLGVNHFLMVDNDSDDTGRAIVRDQPDISLWTTPASYGDAGYGMDWITYLQTRYAHGHWALTVDTDEFLVYPFCDTRPLRALADWLEASAIRSFGAMLLDMYPKGPVSQAHYRVGDDPFDLACWFDSGNYTIKPTPLTNNLWIQGGPRARQFFAHRPEDAPALNKIPFVKWHKRYAYLSSTHMLLPRGLNLVYDQSGGEKVSGLLLHAKFLNDFSTQAKKEAARAEHYRAGHEYQSYAAVNDADLWCAQSIRYQNWQQLEALGLMSKGGWA